MYLYICFSFNHFIDATNQNRVKPSANVENEKNVGEKELGQYFLNAGCYLCMGYSSFIIRSMHNKKLCRINNNNPCATNACHKRRPNGAVHRMRHQDPRSRVTAGVARERFIPVCQV
jgi:hypothetical protein